MARFPPVTEGRDRSKELGWCEDKGHKGDQGEVGALSGSTRTQRQRGDKRLLEPRVDGTSSKSIEPTERWLHGGGGSIHSLSGGKSPMLGLKDQLFASPFGLVVLLHDYGCRQKI